MAFIASVTLQSDKAFKVESGSDGNADFGTLGFVQGTYGGSSDMLNVEHLDVSTQSGAMVAISAAAICWRWCQVQRPAASSSRPVATMAVTVKRAAAMQRLALRLFMLSNAVGINRGQRPRRVTQSLYTHSH